jgi:hypothetical protein
MPSFAFDCSTFAFYYASKGKRRKGKRGALFLCTFAFDYPLLLTTQPLLLAMQRKGKRQRQKATQLMPSFAFDCSNAKAKGAHFFFACKGKSRPTALLRSRQGRCA